MLSIEVARGPRAHDVRELLVHDALVLPLLVAAALDVAPGLLKLIHGRELNQWQEMVYIVSKNDVHCNAYSVRTCLAQRAVVAAPLEVAPGWLELFLGGLLNVSKHILIHCVSMYLKL